MDGVIFEILPVKEIEKSRFSLVEKLNFGAEARLALLLYGKSNEELLSVAHALRLSNEQKRIFTLLATGAEDFECSSLSARRFLRHYGEEANVAAKILSLLGVISPEFEEIVSTEAAKKPCLTLGDLAVSGSDLIALGLASGKGVGLLLSSLLDAVIADPSLNEKENLIETAKELAHE